MASLEDLCNSITSQLALFDQQHSEVCRSLQDENRILRAELEAKSQVSSIDVFLPEGSLPYTSEGSASKRSSLPCVDSLPPYHSERSSACRNSMPCSIVELPQRNSFGKLGSGGSIFNASIFLGGENGLELEGVWLRWHKIVSTLLNMSLFGVQRSKLEHALLLRPAWEASHEPANKRRLDTSAWLMTKSFSSGEKSLEGDTQSLDGEGLKRNRLSKFVLHPDSQCVNSWSILGAMMILYDVLSFPLAGFDLEESDFTVVTMWFTTVFWTCDMVLSFFRGIHAKGVIEMRLSRIYANYVRTWFFIDITMILIDWFVLYMNSAGESSIAGASKVLRSGKALRAARVVRAIRLIRAVKVFQYLREVFENIKSEYVQLLIKLLLGVVLLLLMSHYVSCAWFAQAHFNDSGSLTWVLVFLGNNPRPSFLEEYATSMHFSLTQLTGSQNIVPQNAQERIIASIIIVFDVVMFSTLVGTITDIMAQFRSLTFERSREVTLIRKFFQRYALPKQLESRIWHYFRKHYRSKHSIVNECEIDFFTTLPSSLKMDLHQHLYVPVLVEHPLFNCVMEQDRFSLLAICVTALTTAALVPEFEIFAAGDIAKFMFFITSGSTFYSASQFGIHTNVDAGSWVAEAALWTKWMHCGLLTSNTFCEILKVDTEMFEKTLHERAVTSEWFRGLKTYAALFAQRVSDSFDTNKPIIDVDQNVRDSQGLNAIVDQSFLYLQAEGDSEEEADNESLLDSETEERVIHPKWSLLDINLKSSLVDAWGFIQRSSLFSPHSMTKRNGINKIAEETTDYQGNGKDGEQTLDKTDDAQEDLVCVEDVGIFMEKGSVQSDMLKASL